MRVFAKKQTNRGRKISSELFGSDENDSVQTVHPTPATVEEFTSSSEEEKPESTSTAIARNPRVAKKRKSLETSSTNKKNTFDTSEDEKASDDSDYSTRKKKKKKKKVTKKKRNSKASQQGDEEEDEEFQKGMEEYLEKANQFFSEVDSTKLSKADIKEEEQLILEHSTKEIQETAEKELKAVENARQLIQKSQKQKEVQQEILEGGTRISTETQPSEEERQKEAKRKEYDRYCRSVDGIVEPLPFEEFVARGDNIASASEVTELDDLDFV